MIKEQPYKKALSQMEMVQAVRGDYQVLASELAKAIELAGKAADDITEDMFIGNLEKTIMVNLKIMFNFCQ